MGLHEKSFAGDGIVLAQGLNVEGEETPELQMMDNPQSTVI